VIRAEGVDRDEEQITATEVDGVAARHGRHRRGVVDRLGRGELGRELDDVAQQRRALEIKEANVVVAREPARRRRGRGGA